MIRFGVVASVVMAAVALLIVGALSGDLALVYISIGLAALALVMLVVGVAVWRDQVFAGITSADGPQAADQRARAHPSPVPSGPSQAGPHQAGPAQAGQVQPGRPAPTEDPWARSAAASGWSARPAREPVTRANALPEHEHPADRARRGRERDGRQPGAGRQRPAPSGRPGRQQDPVSADWAGPEPAAAGWTGPAASMEDQPGREPHPPVEQPEPADDPTRLAHKLGIGRQAGPDTDFPAPSARPAEATAASRKRPGQAAEPVSERRSPAETRAGQRPAGSSGSRTRKPDTRAAEAEPAPPASGPATAARPESPAEPAAPGPARARTPAGSPSSGRAAATAARPAAAAARPETGETAVAADVAAAATGGTAARSAAEHTPAAADAASPEAAAADGGTSQAAKDSAPADADVLVVPGIARYHQADCILIRFLGEDDLQRMSRHEAEAAGCAACRACRP